MAFRPTAIAHTVRKQTWFSNISKLPLTSKHGNKDFYKGTGSLPGLGKKRQGRHSPRSKAPYILMDTRMRTFVVPTMSQEEADALKPYVSRAVTPTHPNHWPIAESKPQEHLGLSQSTERQSIYGPNGFDGAYYLQLARAKETGLRAAQPEKRRIRAVAERRKSNAGFLPTTWYKQIGTTLMADVAACSLVESGVEQTIYSILQRPSLIRSHPAQHVRTIDRTPPEIALYLLSAFYDSVL